MLAIVTAVCTRPSASFNASAHYVRGAHQAVARSIFIRLVVLQVIQTVELGKILPASFLYQPHLFSLAHTQTSLPFPRLRLWEPCLVLRQGWFKRLECLHRAPCPDCRETQGLFRAWMVKPNVQAVAGRLGFRLASVALPRSAICRCGWGHPWPPWSLSFLQAANFGDRKTATSQGSGLTSDLRLSPTTASDSFHSSIHWFQKKQATISDCCR